MSIQISAETRLLFIGDSITDCGRRDDPQEFGSGYVRRVHDYLAASMPACAPSVINRGIGGNKIPDLQKRWTRDVLELNPDILSVYIGINDVWHGLAHGREGCPIHRYIAGYRDVLAQTREKLPNCRLVLCEPSVLWLNDPPDANDRLAPYVAAVHELAREFPVECVVPLHEVFEKTHTARPDIALTTDGVHPTSEGHMLIALTWLRSTGING